MLQKVFLQKYEICLRLGGMSKNLIKQIIYCIVFGGVSMVVENCSGSNLIHELIEQNGFVLLAAVYTLSITSVFFILTRISELESRKNDWHIFDKTKMAALRCINEQTVVLIIFYTILILMPNIDASEVDVFWLKKIWIFSLKSLARGAVFFMLYASYDSARASVISCIFKQNS